MPICQIIRMVLVPLVTSVQAVQKLQLSAPVIKLEQPKVLNLTPTVLHVPLVFIA